MKNFTDIEILGALIKLGINPKKYNFTFEDVKKGIKVELEHGTHNKLLDVTHDKLLPTIKIALVHLLETPKYYEILQSVGL